MIQKSYWIQSFDIYWTFQRGGLIFNSPKLMIWHQRTILIPILLLSSSFYPIVDEWEKFFFKLDRKKYLCVQQTTNPKKFFFLNWLKANHLYNKKLQRYVSVTEVFFACVFCSRNLQFTLLVGFICIKYNTI